MANHGRSAQMNQNPFSKVHHASPPPPSSKYPKCKPFRVHTLLCFQTYMDLANPHDTAIYACYCITHLGEFTVPVITKFDPSSHITHSHIFCLHNPNSLPITKFRLLSTKCSPNGKDTQCASLNCLSDPIQALNNHLALNPPHLMLTSSPGNTQNQA
ncbi:hypothetical protein PAXRUDRAFT_796366 [Paxillus rubicundulus Ve08.2h10]|uniref:Uncharacterized protein n=1 Tax=Paxillus rubicundulus Ve08.2h10 TaxID=930991 RepID=A0A0D0D7S8_9AGAM|nr:hypothetical protein PAXRUDRAFT_796366 [Paxillus rubicundulus Ve08.2h10]